MAIPPKACRPSTTFWPLAASSIYPWNVGAVGVLSVAQRLYLLPVGIFGVSMATAIFPLLSKAAIHNDTTELKRLLIAGLRKTLFISLPASVGMILIAPDLITVIYSPQDVDRSAWAAVWFCAGIWAFEGQMVLLRVFYALSDRLTPMKVAVAMVLLNFSLNITLVWFLREGGIALATTLSAIAQSAVLLFILRRRLGALGLRRLAGFIAKGLLACLIMAAAVLLTAPPPRPPPPSQRQPIHRKTPPPPYRPPHHHRRRRHRLRRHGLSAEDARDQGNPPGRPHGPPVLEAASFIAPYRIAILPINRGGGVGLASCQSRRGGVRSTDFSLRGGGAWHRHPCRSVEGGVRNSTFKLPARNAQRKTLNPQRKTIDNRRPTPHAPVPNGKWKMENGKSLTPLPPTAPRHIFPSCPRPAALMRRSIWTT